MLKCSYDIFLSPKLSHLSNLAKSLMIDFVKDFGSLNNVHGVWTNTFNRRLLEIWLCLDQISCFKFENYI